MAATEQALETLYRSRYRGFVAALATVTRSYELAHDAVQEGFARALASRERFSGGSLDAWVMTIAMNAAIDARRRDRSRALADEVPDPQVMSPERNPDLADALRTLSPKRRLVVFLRHYADMSYADIAAVTGQREGTVAATLNRAHAELRRALTAPTESEGLET
jgi:RNA polymerase sigma factor (sigma-70 family)